MVLNTVLVGIDNWACDKMQRSVGLVAAVFLAVLIFGSIQSAFATLTLAQDNGTWDSAGGNPAVFGGVMFTLPSGVASARLRFVRWSAGSSCGGCRASVPAELHVTLSDHVTELPGSPISLTGYPTTTGCPVGWAECYGVDVTSSNFVVSGTFYIIIQQTGGGCTCNDLDFDSSSATHSPLSLIGDTLSTLAPPFFHVVMLRVDVDPITTPPIPEYPIGLSLLAIFMVIAYSLIKRSNRSN